MNRVKIAGRSRPAPSLQALLLSGTAFVEGATAGTVIGTFQNKTLGSTLSLGAADNHLVISGNQLLVGVTPSTAGASLSPSVVETLVGMNGSPKTSGPFPLTVASSVGHGNDGTGTKPAGAIDIANASALSAAITAGLVVGSTYYLAPGDYGEIALDYNKSQYAAPGVTIMGQTGVNVHHLRGFGINGVTLKYLSIYGLYETGSTYGIFLDTCDRVIIDHITVSPVGYGGEGVGIWHRDSTNCTIRYCLVENVGDGIDGYSSTSANENQNYTVAYNRIDGVKENAIFNTRGLNGKVLSNYITRFTGTDPSGHPDCIQQNLTVNEEIAYNHCNPLSYGVTGSCGGIFTEYCTGLNIHDNCEWFTNSNSISLAGTNTSVINDNYTNGGARIIVRDLSNTVAFNRNQAPYNPPIDDNTSGGANTNITYGIGANANVTIASPSSITDTASRDAFISSRGGLIPTS